MKITTISKVVSLVISSVMIQTAVAGHAVGIGVGPHFSGSGIFGMFFGSGGFHSAPAFGGGARLTIPPHQRDPVSSIDRQSTVNSRPQIASRIQQPSERAGNHIFSRQGASVHRDGNRHSAHYWHGHWWAWDGVAWLGLDEGY